MNLHCEGVQPLFSPRRLSIPHPFLPELPMGITILSSFGCRTLRQEALSVRAELLPCYFPLWGMLTNFLSIIRPQIVRLETPLWVPLGEIRDFNRTHMANMKERVKHTAGDEGSNRWILTFAGGGGAFQNQNKIHPVSLQEFFCIAYCLEPPKVTRVSHRLQRTVDKAHKEFFTSLC